MKDLDFYIVPNSYITYLQKAESIKWGFTRVPNMDYGKNHKPKFICGIVLEINDVSYFVPVSSYKFKKPDNFLICDFSRVVYPLCCRYQQLYLYLGYGR